MEGEALVCRRLLITGRVQGVGFRWSCQRQARALGVAGWVRNRSDGTVEALVEGPQAAVDQLLSWCRTGPPGARVTDVAVEPATPRGATGFVVSY